MKKNILFVFFVLISLNIYSKEYIEGNEYIKIKNVNNIPKILEFFSFYCIHCYEFECFYKIPQEIKKNLPSSIKIERYHVDFFGPLGKELTKAWAVAIALKIEDKMIPIFFEGIIKTKTIKNKNDIINAFVKVNVSNKKYNYIVNSFLVKSIIKKQQNAAKHLNLQSVPSFFVNGKYKICNDVFFTEELTNYGKDYSELVKFLINKI
ncbi:DsbA family protein [Candidatus Providencia siddallii]|uniref:Thiol:disulfide interchange protein n=1 Tax=Candidatus Providencia siddallii TaxID=1715285 RepID=A0ABM9NPG9_9GAMM